MIPVLPVQILGRELPNNTAVLSYKRRRISSEHGGRIYFRKVQTHAQDYMMPRPLNTHRQGNLKKKTIAKCSMNANGAQITDDQILYSDTVTRQFFGQTLFPSGFWRL
jgi:hypothetical protein